MFFLLVHFLALPSLRKEWTADHPDKSAILALSRAVTVVNSIERRSLRDFVSECLVHLPHYIDRFDAKLSNFVGTYTSDLGTKIYTYQVFLCHLGARIWSWLTGPFHSGVSDPDDPAVLKGVVDCECKRNSLCIRLYCSVFDFS